jgi:hypothetical protein
MCHWAKTQSLAHSISNRIDRFVAEFLDATTFHADQVIMIRHSGGQLEMRTVALKPVFHQNTARREQVERRIDRSARNAIAPSIHIQIELVCVEMTVQFSDPIDHVKALLCAAVLLSFEEVRKLALERFIVWWQGHGHKYTCAYFCAPIFHSSCEANYAQMARRRLPRSL